MNLKRIIKSELLFESLEDRLKSAYQKWCKKTKSKRQQTLDNIYDADGYVEELAVYSSDFSDPYSKMYQKAEELYAKEDYKGIVKMIADHQCGGVYIDREFKEWLSYRNLMKSSDIFQYKSEDELKVELRNAKEKSFTKKLKKASAGEDFDKIWENDDMLIVVPKSHVGACKFGQGTRWCTASKNNNYFDSYYKAGILYRILQKNDNYKKLLSDFAYIRDIDNLSKVSVNLKRKNGSISMVDKTDNAYRHERTEEFLHYLPKEAYKAIKNYQNLNEQKIKRIIREEMGNFDWVNEIKPSFVDFIKQHYSTNGQYTVLIDSISMEEQLTIMDKLYDHGFSWRGGHGRYDTSRLKIPVLHLDTKDMVLAWDELPSTYVDLTHNHFLDDEDKEPTEIPTEIPKEDFFTALGMGVNGVNESLDSFDWVGDSEPTITNSYGIELPINTKEAKDNFKKEVHGHYVISTPIENENEETVLAFGSVSYLKRVIFYINKHLPKEQRLYLATIRYSKKERDNVLSYIRYY